MKVLSCGANVDEDTDEGRQLNAANAKAGGLFCKLDAVASTKGIVHFGADFDVFHVDMVIDVYDDGAVGYRCGADRD